MQNHSQWLPDRLGALAAGVPRTAPIRKAAQDDHTFASHQSTSTWDGRAVMARTWVEVSDYHRIPDGGACRVSADGDADPTGPQRM